MIVPQENDTSKASPKADDPNETDPPPTYQPDDRELVSGSNVRVPLDQFAPDVKPSNFILLERNSGRVNGTWLIDPALSIPAAFLPPLKDDETEEARKNIAIEAKDGSVDVDIYVMPLSLDAGGIVESSTKRTRVTIHTSSRDGNVTTRVHWHDVHPLPSLEQTRPPLFINSFASDGSISIYIPRSFRGPLRLKVHDGSVKFSDSVRPQLTPFSETGGVQRSFIGRFDAAEFLAGTEWSGDELVAESKDGSIRVYYNDEASIAVAKKKELGFFGRLINSLESS